VLVDVRKKCHGHPRIWRLHFTELPVIDVSGLAAGNDVYQRWRWHRIFPIAKVPVPA